MCLLVAGGLLISIHIAGAETLRMGYFELRPHMYNSEVTGQPKRGRHCLF